jgi:hypothetical protein
MVLTLRVGVVVRHMRTTVGLLHTEVGEQKGHGLRGHRRAAIGMHGQLVASDVLLRARLLEQRHSQRFTLPVRHQPADYVTAEDVEDHVQLKVRPLDRSVQPRDVPRPDLAGSCGEQLRLRVLGPLQLRAPFAHLTLGAENPVHGGDRTEVHPFIEQRGIHLRGRAVGKAFRVECREYARPLLGRETARRASRRNLLQMVRPSARGRRPCRGSLSGRACDRGPCCPQPSAALATSAGARHTTPRVATALRSRPPCCTPQHRATPAPCTPP